MNGKQVIFVAGDKNQPQILNLSEKLDNCVFITTVTELEELDKIDNVVFYYQIEDTLHNDPVRVVTELFGCIKQGYRELLMRRGIKIWFALLPELEAEPDRKIINAGITSLMQILGFEFEKRKIPVNCIKLEKDKLDKIGVLLKYATENPVYLNLQTI